MKRRGVSFIFLFILILSISLVLLPNISADANSTATKAYSCLQGQVSGKCSSLTTEEKIFSLLAINSCKSEVLADSKSGGQCWPAASCKIKTTAQAILALNSVNTNTATAENWLLSQTQSSSDLSWFLQTDTQNQSATCSVTYTGGSYSFLVNSDKTLTGGSSSGNCLSVYNSYWLKISPTCYNLPFQISCDNNFLTSLLYKKVTSSTIYVSQETSSAPGEGTTTEQVSSSCFEENGACTYEGTLWAAMVLKYRNHDVSAYIPYLTAMADQNSQLLPEAFLYYLTNSYRTELLAKQAQSAWWSASGDKFYDTAVALLPFQNEQPAEKTNAINWLSQVQGSDGCWQDNTRNTAFLLYSIWPKQVAAPAAQDCKLSGNYCESSASCSAAGGTEQTSYTGCSTDVCCDKPQLLQSCSQQNGDLCSSGQSCLGGSQVSSADSTGGQFCCVGGTCGTQTQQSTCEQNGGYCKSSCEAGEQQSYTYSCSSGVCCVPQPPSSVNILVIIILAVLILLVLLAIIFRKKLRPLFSNFGKRKPKPPRPGLGPGPGPWIRPGGPRPGFPPSRLVYPGLVPRRIIPQQQATPAMSRPQPKRDTEIDDVLKKLKDIGKEEPKPAKPSTVSKPEEGTEKKEVKVRAHTRTVNTKKK